MAQSPEQSTPLSPAPVTPSPTDQLNDLGLPEHTMSPGPQPPSAWKTLPQSLCSGTPIHYLPLGLGLILPGDGPPRPTWVTPALQAGARLAPLGSPSRAQPKAWHTVGAQLIGVSQALLRPSDQVQTVPRQAPVPQRCPGQAQVIWQVPQTRAQPVHPTVAPRASPPQPGAGTMAT